jgi:hypothetical protein
MVRRDWRDRGCRQMAPALALAVGWVGAGCAAPSAGEGAEGVASAQEELTSACRAFPSAANCDYQDPVVAGCDTDAITLASKQISGWPYYDWVEQRYSAACQSRYTRYTAADGIVSEVILTRVNPSTRITYAHNGTLNYTDLLYCPRGTCAAWSGVLIDEEKTAIGPVY